MLHLPGQGFTQGLAEALRAVYVPLAAGHKKRIEEWDALDVIPMRMADQDVAAQAFSASRHQILT
jgi:multisubunit Na+/H+ antiporter MnhB subunit